MQCIYQIRNILNDKIYIGSSVDFARRKYCHLRGLYNNKHHSNHLQKSWNKYGEHNFVFEILEKVTDKHLLIEREQYYIDLTKSYDATIGYNISPIAGSQLGFKHSIETKKKISELQIGKSYIDKFGIVKAQELIEKIRKSNTGKKRSQKYKNSVSGSNNARYGKTHSLEARSKISKSGIGRIPPNKDKRMILQYDLLGNFIKELKGSDIPIDIKGNVIACCTNKRNKTAGFMWVYKMSNEIQLNIDPVRRKTNSSKISVAVLQYDLDNNFINEWASIAKAQKELGIKTSICKCCKGTRNKAGGFIWKYKP